jgi:hypothetical protein
MQSHCSGLLPSGCWKRLRSIPASQPYSRALLQLSCSHRIQADAARLVVLLYRLGLDLNLHVLTILAV